MNASEKVNILLVDDQPQRLLSYETILEPLRENLLRASSGNEALEILLKADVAVILMDVVMPEMDGFEVARAVRGHPRFHNTPIIFVTAISTSDMERAKGYELGAVDYVCVPIVPEILRAKVAVFVDLHRKTRELQSLNRELEQRVAERTGDLAKTLATLAEYTAKLEQEIAERARLEAELRQQASQLAAADRRKDEFLAMLAHELRNPLAPIRTATDILLLKGSNLPVLRRARELIDRQVAHMTRLLDDLLDVSRITGGKIRIAKEPLDVAEAIAQAVETVRPVIDEKRHRLHVAMPNKPVRLEADPTRLVQVLANLLNNAAKYTEPGGDIWIEGDLAGDEVVVRVRDTGIGIAPDMLPHVFDLFAQADRTLDRSQGGLGIGLTLVHKLVEMHGGSVFARSTGLGHGSEFAVHLPVLRAAATAESQLPECMPISSPARVLVVDDSADVAEAISMLLGMLGHEVYVANSGQEAIDAVRTLRPDVVLLDIGLPGMDGYQVARCLREQPDANGLYLIAVSGYGQEEDLARSKAAGFDHHLVKPVGADALQAAIAERAGEAMVTLK
jgi:signal transduction histidine kinase